MWSSQYKDHNVIRSRRRAQRGQDTIEYAFLLMLIALIALIGLKYVGQNTNNNFNQVSNGLKCGQASY